MPVSRESGDVPPIQFERGLGPERRWRAGAIVELGPSVIWEIVDGVVLLRRGGEQGPALVLEILPAGTVLGPAGVSEPMEIFAATAVRLKPVSIAQAVPGLLRRIAALHERSIIVAQASADQRMAWLLSGLADAAPRPVITLPLRQTELASYLGLTPETIARTLTAMERRGLLARLRRGVIDVLEPEQLRAVHNARLRRRRVSESESRAPRVNAASLRHS